MLRKEGILTMETVKMAYIRFPCGCISDRGFYKPCKLHKQFLLVPWPRRVKLLPSPKLVRFEY